MPAKTPFTDKQHAVLHRAVQSASKDKKRFKNQEQLALAIGMTQQSLSAYLLKKWKVGVEKATAIAHLEGVTLEQLVGPYKKEKPVKASKRNLSGNYPNLDTCIDFYATTHAWSPWTVAAAHAGFYGVEDFPPPKWVEKLSALEKLLDESRKTG